MIIHPQNYTQYPHVQIGGKAKGLLHLHELGFNVPEWCAIPEEFEAKCLNQVWNSPEKYAPSQIQQAIEELNLGGELLRELEAYFSFGPASYFAVRSSASAEDGEQHSFAGQYKSFLFVAPENLEEKIKEVWLSAFSKHLQTYQNFSDAEDQFLLSVVIQRMVNPEVSGVAFGANPISGNRQEKLINAVFGLGEGLVSGKLNADTYCIHPEKGLSAHLANKEQEAKWVSGELQYQDLPISQKLTPTLSDQQVAEIAQVLDKLYQKLEVYQDIEFAYEKDELYLLQARPITHLKRLPQGSSSPKIWDNSNIIESYPGQTSPLTFSFILKVYRAVYIQFSELMGVERQLIQRHDEIYSHMLGLIQGRVYYNLLNWYKALSLFPGYRVNKTFMEQMMGVKESIEEEVAIPSTDSRWKAFRKLFMAMLKMFQAFFTLKKERKKFQAYLRDILPTYQNISYEMLSVQESMAHYQQFESILLKKWRAPLINDFFAMIFFGLLKKHVQKLAPDHPNLCNDLLIGSHDIISVEPARRIQKLLTLIRNHPSSQEFFQTNSASEIWKQRDVLPSPIHREIESYVEIFGDRCTGELKLETLTFRSRPDRFIELLQSQLAFEVDLQAMEEKGKERRKLAESQLKNRLRNRFLYKWFFAWVLKHARSLVSNRENLRFERTRAFGIVRQIFQGIGSQFYQKGLIEEIEDIFFLQQSEILAYTQGTSVQKDLKTLIALRKKEYREHSDAQMADRIETQGIPYVGNSYTKNQQDIGSPDLKGWGCSPGIVEGEVLVVHSPQEVPNAEGKIVVCECTDPGWITLFATCSALIVQRGSLLSHSAIVSREMGIPCIVSVPNLLQTLQTGDRVKIDGSTGEIIVQQAQTPYYESSK